MAGYTEQDPLLPNSKGSPEVHGSRPQSTTDDYVKEDVQDDEQPRRSIWGNLLTILVGACLLFGLFSILSQTAPFEDEDPSPRTIEERVNQILAQTPLIG